MKDLDYCLCIICQESKRDIKLRQPTADAFKNIINQIEIRLSHGDSSYADLYPVLKSVSHEQLTDIHGEKWHPDCYKEATNKTKIERLKARSEKLQKQSDIPVVLNAKVGRPSKESAQPSSENNDDVSPSRPKREKLDKLMCWLCQEDLCDTLHKVSSVSITSQMKTIAEHHNDKRI